ncbi:hypothetical protein COV81_04610 [Candidatus Peregrinibacteria bacterium CG11_big_fil_rev_8_21_14_0_20_41_10]|nr:MAG: hypothetical protein COV81_04610 [Candidatus Peregrinibacteria bacterium CG11_big_fil_rev_8_21_14_0_20_41_10]PJC37716.1 MAG: hypothetical protein CO045_04035 [Candidatus Peregrinibacteria bacterium CG_4_9_14_0_2_um_filter_41_14]
MANIFDENSEFKKYLEGKSPGKKIEDPKVEPKTDPLPDPKPATVLHIDNAASSTYKLDLSSHHIKPPPAAFTPTPVAPRPLKPAKARSKGYNFFVENLKTVLYGIIIFIIGYIALNFNAYYEVGQNVYYDLINIERSSVLTTFNTPDAVIPDDAIVAAASTETVTSIPPFDMEITPPGTRIIIPRLNKNVPIVNVPEDNLVKKNWAALENDLQTALRNGVVHYPGTPWPGQSGNVVVTGHSSYYPWDPGRFKDVFAVLHNVKIGDEIIVFHNQQKYRYQVTESSVVLPQQVQVLADTGDNRITLLTCTPIGTNLKRLIVTAKLIAT